MFAGFVFALAFADLLFDFFGDEIDGGVEVIFDVFGEEVGSGDFEADGAGELAFGGFGLVEDDGDAGGEGKAVEVGDFLHAGDDVIFDGLGFFQVMGRDDQVHGWNDALDWGKIQRKIPDAR